MQTVGPNVGIICMHGSGRKVFESRRIGQPTSTSLLSDLLKEGAFEEVCGSGQCPRGSEFGVLGFRSWVDADAGGVARWKSWQSVFRSHAKRFRV